MDKWNPHTPFIWKQIGIAVMENADSSPKTKNRNTIWSKNSTSGDRHNSHVYFSIRQNSQHLNQLKWKDNVAYTYNGYYSIFNKKKAILSGTIPPVTLVITHEVVIGK